MSALASGDVRAYIAEAAGVPFEAKAIQRRNVRENDVAISVLYCGVCHSDLHQWKNEWGFGRYPMVPGHEIVGVVSEVGSKVTKFKVGQRVGVGCISDSCNNCDRCDNDMEQHCKAGMTQTYADDDKIAGGVTYGGYSERIVIEDRYVLSIPDGLDLAETAPLLCAGITVYTPLKLAKITTGSVVAINGIGGLGHVAIKIAKALGATVIAFTSKKEKTEELKKLGADTVVVSSDSEALKAHANSINLIIDTISAGHDVASLFSTLTFEGIYHLVGAPPVPLQVPSFPLIMKRIQFTGSLIGGIKSTQEMLDICGKHKIGAQIEILPLKDINTAMERLEKGDVRYRFVMDVKSTFQ